jgi:catechol 2,3-dioxygenase-like lactoylglutathione lyase family enzyme
MEMKCPLLAVTDMEKSVTFYEKILGLQVIMDFGENKTLTGGLNLQTVDTWKEFIGTDDISFGSNSCEIYFDADDFDEFAKKLEICDVEYVHPVKEYPWGQRVVRIYDPDKHILEIGENATVVCKRFSDSGMTPEQIAERMDVPVKVVNDWMQ